MIPTGSTAPGDYVLEVRRGLAICADCQTAVHVGQTAKVGQQRVVHQHCIHPSQRTGATS